MAASPQSEPSSKKKASVWSGLRASSESFESAEICTQVKKIVGLLLETGPLRVPMGSRLVIHCSGNGKKIPVELVGFSETGLFLMPYGNMEGVALGDDVYFESSSQELWLSEDLLGHVLDGEGKILDSEEISRPDSRPIYREAPPALSRERVDKTFFTGIRAVDAFTTIGRGQRMGVFAGTGVGKSILLGMIARNAVSDINVLALVGERGYEVRDFIEKILGKEGMKKSIVVVATSDQSPLMRIRAAFLATTIAEYFAEKGNNVLFLLDSITRMAMAGRELGLSIGEPPTAKGYPPSVFSMMPRLLERAGTFPTGSITSIISVLLEGDDLQDPIGDAVRGVLDGHIVLDRNLASRGHYPAIEISESLSRWMMDLVDEEQDRLSKKGRRILSHYRDAEDLINVGAYVQGSNPDIDEAILFIASLRKFLVQSIDEFSDPADLKKQLAAVFEAKATS